MVLKHELIYGVVELYFSLYFALRKNLQCLEHDLMGQVMRVESDTEIFLSAYRQQEDVSCPF